MFGFTEKLSVPKFGSNTSDGFISIVAIMTKKMYLQINTGDVGLTWLTPTFTFKRLDELYNFEYQFEMLFTKKCCPLHLLKINYGK